MPSSAKIETLRAGARALAHDDGLEPSLLVILRATAASLGMASAAVFVTTDRAKGLEIAASIGLADPAALKVAVQNPAHPIARTAAERAASFDANPMAPGGPALRSHLPLSVTRGGSSTLVGVLAVAHDHPTDPEARAILEAAADLMAVAVERIRTPA